MPSSVKDDDAGMRRIITELKALQGAQVLVGIQGDEDEDFVKVAAVQEYGSDPAGPSPGHIPERSYLRATADEDGDKLDLGAEIAIDQVLQGRPAMQTLRLFGLGAVALVKKRIQSRIDPPNAESTIKRKGSDVPLVDKGRLINSIRAKVILPDGKTETTEHTTDAAT